MRLAPKGGLRKWLAALLLIVVTGLILLRLLAPQVFVLAREGFPDPVWPVRGVFATVQGADPATALSPGQPMPPASLASFNDASGRALLMARDGQLLIEDYAPGITRETRLNSYSMVKSLIGAMILRGVADGRIADLDDSLSRYLGKDAPDVSIRQALTMTSGLRLGEHPEKAMDDGAFSPFSGIARLHAFGIQAIMPGLHPDPAEQGSFGYASVNTALLGAVLESAYGEALPDILSREIWQPAGAQTAFWRKYPAGDGVTAYCCLYARPLDWLLVGQYIMSNTDQAFLPDDLWQQFLLPDLPAEERAKGVYGDQVRHDVLDRMNEKIAGPFAYFFGHRGQITYLLPDLDIVAVRFGDQPQLLHSTLYELFR